VPITLPDLGDPRAVFSLWYVRPGDRVYEGDRVAEVLIPGATFDVPAPATGTLTERSALPNDPVTPGQVLGTIQEEN
jgi:pyruvate/2-oxoglutarate dehydrogenase complex dihydrolipoamide acyltransferase (E2) component